MNNEKNMKIQNMNNLKKTMMVDDEEDGLDHKRAILQPYKQSCLLNSTEMSAWALATGLCAKG